MDSVFESPDQGQPSLLVSLDISDAFDAIKPTEVWFGVSDSPLTWLQSCLADRYQCVRVGQASSSPTLCHTGVPQGSFLGPILFSCYTSQSVSLQTHLASAYNSIIIIMRTFV